MALVQWLAVNVVLPLSVGVASNFAYDWLKKRRWPSLPVHPAVVGVAGAVLTLGFVAALGQEDRYRLKLTTPVPGENVQSRFAVRGTTANTSRNMIVCVVMNRADETGSPWVIVDSNLISSNGWWSAVGSVDLKAPIGAQYRVFAYRVAGGDECEVNRSYRNPPAPEDGGRSDVVTVKFAAR